LLGQWHFEAPVGSSFSWDDARRGEWMRIPEVTHDPAAASLPRRSAAAAIDAVPGVIVASALLLARLRRNPSFKPHRSLAIAVQGLNLVGSSWLIADGGATPGQRLLGLRVVRALKRRRINDARHIVIDAARTRCGPGEDTQGAAQSPARPALTLNTGSSAKSQPRTRPRR